MEEMSDNGTAPEMALPEVKETKDSVWKDLLRLLLKAAALAAIIWALFTYVFGIHIQKGNSMYPFLMDGDLVIYYRRGPCVKGDMAAYRSPETGKVRISRIAVTGKHEVQVTTPGELIVDGTVPEEKVFYPTKPLEGSLITFPYQMEEGDIFLLDDHREEGRDSRIFGAVQQEEILGKVVYLFRRRGF